MLTSRRVLCDTGTMNSNPYQSGNAPAVAPRTRATRWMVWAGAVAILLAGICLIATVIGMMWSFEAVATTSATPKPSDLSNGISNALLPSIVAAPLALVGIVLLILGFVRRQPVDGT